MILITKALRTKFEKTGSQEGLGMDAEIIVKFFTPDSSWSMYALEFDGEDSFFGIVDGHFAEYGYFSLRELKKVKGNLGLPIERDLHFTGQTVRDLIGKFSGEPTASLAGDKGVSL